jgi:hypothetical protein
VAGGCAASGAPVQPEEWPIWQHFTRHVRALAATTGPLGQSERQGWIRIRQGQACSHPGWTPQQIRDHAARSWGPPIKQQTESTGGRWTA